MCCAIVDCILYESGNWNKEKHVTFKFPHLMMLLSCLPRTPVSPLSRINRSRRRLDAGARILQATSLNSLSHTNAPHRALSIFMRSASKDAGTVRIPHPTITIAIAIIIASDHHSRTAQAPSIRDRPFLKRCVPLPLPSRIPWRGGRYSVRALSGTML